MSPLLIFIGLTLLALAAGDALLIHLARRTATHGLGTILSWVCRIALAIVFLWAAYGKVRDPYAFASSVYAYRVVPAGIATVTGVVMPALEIVASLALLSGILWRGGALVLAGMLLVFIAALFQAILRGIDINCGCFGQGSSQVSFWLIARNYGLVLLALFALARDRWRAPRAAGADQRDRLGFSATC
jgi:putative oxidoreductase